MIILKNYVITWDYESGDSYLFGSNINYIAPDCVEFENNLLPPGTDIRSWRSKMNFQVNKMGNILPILSPEKQYWIKLNVKLKENESMYIKVEFYNRFNDLLDFKIIYGQDSFIYPKAAAYYSIVLVNNGVSNFVFQNIVLSTDEFIEDIPGYTISNIKNCTDDSTELTVIFTEPISREIQNINNKYIVNYKDVIIVNSSLLNAHLYLEPDFQEHLKNTIENFKEKYEISNVRFVGYGPISNFSAVYYSHCIGGSNAKITNEWLNSDKYNNIIKRYSLKEKIGISINDNIDIDKSKLEIYPINNRIDKRFSKIYDRSNILEKMEVRK